MSLCYMVGTAICVSSSNSISEVKQTGAEGERMKEGAMINKSLILGLTEISVGDDKSCRCRIAWVME